MADSEGATSTGNLSGSGAGEGLSRAMEYPKKSFIVTHVWKLSREGMRAL